MVGLRTSVRGRVGFMAGSWGGSAGYGQGMVLTGAHVTNPKQTNIHRVRAVYGRGAGRGGRATEDERSRGMSGVAGLRRPGLRRAGVPGGYTHGGRRLSRCSAAQNLEARLADARDAGSWGLPGKQWPGMCEVDKIASSPPIVLSSLERPQPPAALLSVFMALRVVFGFQA